MNVKPPIEFTKEENARPLIKKLGLHITDRMFIKDIKTTDAEYCAYVNFTPDDTVRLDMTVSVYTKGDGAEDETDGESAGEDETDGETVAEDEQ